MSERLFPFFLHAPPPPDGACGGGDAALRLHLTVWTRGRWQARAEWGEGQQRLFDSPFELARFLATPPPPPAADPGRGLR